MINDIGDIAQRLRTNKLHFIRKLCSASDIVETTYNIQECLCSANIRYGLKQQNANRIIFIIDRRYNGKDHMYCFIPPQKYSTLTHSTDHSFHIQHTYHTSRFLLPSSFVNNRDSMGASDSCKGYMFALSFIVYKQSAHEFATKIYFYSQGGKVRLRPNHIEYLWPKYFVKEKNFYLEHKLNPLIAAMFSDECHEEKQTFMHKMKEWAIWEKTLCQSNIIHEIRIPSKQALASTTSTNTTPTTQMTQTTSHRYTNQNDSFDIFMQQKQKKLKHQMIAAPHEEQINQTKNGLVML